MRVNTFLRDGSAVELRPLGMGDALIVSEGFRRLSPESRHQRFWSRMGDELGPDMLKRLLEADQVNHAVWGIIDHSLYFPGLGAASYWRQPDDPLLAEFSVTVSDDHRRRGVATALLATLWLWAVRNGIERFVGYAQPTNRGAIRWMLETGAQSEWDGYKAILRWDLHDLNRIPPTHTGAELVEWIDRLGDILLET